MNTDSDANTPDEHGTNEQKPPVPMPQQPNSAPTQAERDTKQEQDIRELKRRERILFRVAVLGAVIAAVSAGVSTLQWLAANEQVKIMRAQLKDARDGAAQARKDTNAVIAAAQGQAESMKTLAEANRVMADAAKLSAQNSGRIAKASEGSVETTQESLRLEQRAWIGVRGVKDIMFNAGKPAGVTIVVINSGRTPALTLQGQIVVEFVPVGATPFTNWPPAQVGLLESNQVLNPGAESELQRYTELPISESDAENVRLRRLLVYARTKITYRDVFGRQHQTTYCGRLNYARTSFELCADGNEAD